MQIRNKLWKGTKKHKACGGDIRVLNPDGSLKDIIPVAKQVFRKSVYEVRENNDPLNDRVTPRYAKWRQSIKDRDHNMCILCGSQEWIEVHHIIRWIDNESSRLKHDNGVCLCIICHRKHHAPDNRPFPKYITEQLLKHIKEVCK